MDIKQAVKLAMHSMELEGFIYTDNEKALFARLAKGEITCDYLRRYFDSEHVALKASKPWLFVE